MRIILEIVIIIVVYLVGYKSGWHDCFKFLGQKLKEYLDETEHK